MQDPQDAVIEPDFHSGSRIKPISHILLWICSAFIVIALIWAHFAVVDEVTVAPGKVIPSNKVQILQNLEGGVLEKILVKEGEHVNKSQILMEVDDTRFSSDFRETELALETLSAKITRLTAEINQQPLVFPPTLKTKIPNIIKNEQAIYHSRQQELQLLTKRRDLLKKEIDMTAPLVKEGIVSEVELLHLKQNFNNQQKEIAEFQSAALNELNQANVELNKLGQTKIAAQDRLERTDIRAPISGIIKQIHINTIGGVIKPGMDLIEIVPDSQNLVIEANVSPADIGFLHPGQKAMVKFSAYDFSIYGGLPATVTHISADTSANKEGESFYEVWVRTQQNYLQKGKQKLNIIPGMHANVDIITGQKTVLDYLLKPILKTKQLALRER